MPLQATSGAASYDAFGGGAAPVPNYIEDVFSTWLYNGGNPPKTITNGIDLAGKGGLVWTKSRNLAEGHRLVDTVRGATKALLSNESGAQVTETGGLTSFSSTGYVVSFDSGYNGNTTTDTYVGWTFREQPKFFDVVTWTGDGVAGRDINHSLGSVPGCVIIKRTDSTSNWSVYHKDLRGGVAPFLSVLYLNTTAAQAADGAWMFDGPPTDTTLSLRGGVNAIGATYVAYLFAHNAGGFGLTGTDNVISCGSYATNSSFIGPNVNLGFEPAWILVKNASGNGAWHIIDNMRGWTADGNVTLLNPNTSSAESTTTQFKLNATGFQDNGAFAGNATMIYIAIRRGPMKTPTTGTSVFQPLTRNGTGGATTVTSTVRPDTVLQNWRSGGLGSANHFMYDRLRGVARALFTDTTGAESTQTATGINAFNNLSYGIAGAGSMNNGSALYADYVFTRAPGFFDEVCYTGNGGSNTLTHNLAAAPELVIIKSRSSALSWQVGSGFTASNFVYNTLESTDAGATFTYAAGVVFSAQPTASSVFLNSSGGSNGSGSTYVAYLFASCPGVSKVGSYIGTGASDQVINCGFTGGARFVMIKRTDGTSNWRVWDTARGIASGNDPSLDLNNTSAEQTGFDQVDPDSSGFKVKANDFWNTSGANFIFLAIA